MGLIDNWLFWMPDARLQGWIAYSAAIIGFWFLALRLLRKMIGYAPPLWALAILFLFPCRIALTPEGGESASWLAPALPTLLLSLFGNRQGDLLAALEAVGLAAGVLLPAWLARRFYLRAASGRLWKQSAAHSRDETADKAAGGTAGGGRRRAGGAAHSETAGDS